LLVCYDDDDDEERSDSLDDNIISGLPPFSAITPNEPVLSTEEPDNSLSMGDEHLDTIPATESDEPQPPQSLVIHQPHQELSIQEMEDLKQQYLDELKRLSNLECRDENKIAELTENFNGMSIEIRKKEKLLQQEQWAYLSTHHSKCFNSFCYNDDDDEDYTIAVTPSLSIEEPDNSLSMGGEYLDTIPATESDEVIKSSVENLIPIPSESEGIPEHKCDVPSHDNSPSLDVSKDQIEDLSESTKEFSSIDDDSFSIENIDYVEASPPDSELVSSEVMEIVIPEVGGIDDDILLTIKDDILREKLLNVNLLIAKIEALNANPTSSSDFKTKSPSTSLNSLLEEANTFDNSLPEFETFCFDVEEISSGSTTTHFDISLSEYETFCFDVEEISRDPISHFLFILIMETLHLTFKRVLNAGLYKGISLNDSFTISHVFYADDVVFIGLKINLHKSKLMGIGVSLNVVAAAASLIGCSILTVPFNYLGVKVGSNMSRITSWDNVISKVSSRLSKWKLKLLSIGGRLSLLKSVLTSILLYHMSIFKVPIGVLNHLESIRRNLFYRVDGSDRKLAWIGWNMVLTSKKNGAIFGNKEALDTHKLIPRRSPWQDVILAIHSLQSK
nr:RNA-directed DNA polymerase, eukaryota [Tanacetum cinerariifolium]